MNENENELFADFESVFAEDPGYQTEDDAEDISQVDEPAETDEPETEDEDGQDAPDGDDPQEDPEIDDPSTKPEKGATEPQKAEETFTLKVNKEEKTYSREEVIALAQKGADYDRVKEKAAKNQSIIDSLQEVAKASGTDLDGLITSLRVQTVMQQENVSEDVAKERVRALRAEEENSRLKAQTEQPEPSTPKDRVADEVTQFRSKYPDVALTEELVNSLMEDVRGGMSLTDAYEKHVAAQKDLRIRQLEEQLAAEKQNNKNRAGAISSQRDSGGRRSKTDFDYFEAALFG